MGCCGGDREKFGALTAEQKWEYINLDDFKSSSCWTPFAYGYLLVMGVVSISVYGVDTFTAIQLLAFDRWAGQIKPEIPLNISRWIFAGCIILSFILLVYRWWRAIRVIQQGGVAKSYLDPLAVRVQSVRWGQGRGWKRFLVFAELTKSRKGADYVALFAYFSFEAWLRIVFAEGPRQVINAITLYSVLRLKLIPVGEHAPDDGHSPVVQFFVNIGILADSNHLQAVVLFGMLWTLVIWVISVISLMVSVVLYLLFLWHHIPSRDGGLTGYCRNKINRRMERIVRTKVDKALRKENQLRARQEAQAAREGLDVKKQPTLPNLGTDAVDSFPGLSRQTTMTTLPEYTSRPGTGRNSNELLPTLPNISSRPPMPMRTVTHGSTASFESFTSNAPLMNSAGEMSTLPDSGQDPAGAWYGNTPSNRNPGMSQFSQRSYSPAPPRPGTAQGNRHDPGSYQMDPLRAPARGMSNSSLPRYNPNSSGGLPYPDDRSSTSSKAPSWSGSNSEPGVDTMGRRQPAAVGPTFRSISEERGRMSPLPGPQFRAQTPVRGPERSFTPTGPPPRSMTAGGPPPVDRSFTPNSLPPRAMTPSGGPTLPRLQTTSASGYIPYSEEPRSMTPASSIPPNATIRSVNEPARSYSPFRPQMSGPQGRAPPQRQGSAVDDILDHY